MSQTVSDHNNDSGRQEPEERPDALELQQQLLAELREQTRHLAALRAGAEIDSCLLEQIGRIVCMTANETHRNGQLLEGMAESLAALLAMYRGAHPDQALQLERLAKLEAELRRCCPEAAAPELICRFEPCEPHGGFRPGDGYSVKSRGIARPLDVGERPHEPWVIRPHEMHEEEFLPAVPRGPLVGPLVPVAATARPLDFRSGGGPAPGGGAQEPVTFRTFTESGVSTGIWPPDMSGAKAGDVVVMSGNLWLKLSMDGGKTFTDVDFTKVFAAETTYGGWAGDQVIHYVPQIDCFVLYVQSRAGAKGSANQSKNVVKVALASPADLKTHTGGKAAWRRQWHFTSDDFGITAWMDFPDLSYGDAFLYINTNTYTRTFNSAGKEQNAFAGKLFFELPLKELQAGSGFSYYYAMLTESLSYGSPMQNIRDENYWAAHVNNSTMRIYSSKGNDPNYYWRERKLKANWPLAKNDANGVPDIVSSAPDSGDWISTEHRIIGATKVVNQLWFAWTAANGKSDAGGFEFPKPHVQIAKFDLTQDYACVDQMQVWNPDVAYTYPSLTTNSNNEVGISLAWGGGTAFGSHAVGILGDFVVWFGDASDMTSTRTSPTRFGDYLHVRLAHPDTRFFSAFGYAVNKTSATPPAEDDRYIYVEFGREAIAPPPLH
jgi:hypothetical protein